LQPRGNGGSLNRRKERVMNKIRLFTIGFTKKSAEDFFKKLSEAGVRRVLDIRLNNTSQLAGFAKKDDLQYFLKTICNMDYVYLPQMAPTKDILEEYRKTKGDWSIYEDRFLALLSARKPQESISRDMLNGGCLLCSEHKPENCHRRLVAEYLRQRLGNVEIVHIT
jgi:uncharacterized protein (DUF488 family)